MAIQLSQPDFQRLVSIVQNLSSFANVYERRELVAGTLVGVPQADVMLANLNLDGAPMTAAVRTVRFLADFGQVAYGKEVLGVFLNNILPLMGYEDERATFIRGLFGKYPLDAPVSANRPIDHWRGIDSITDVHEKIIGENTLIHINTLEIALDAAKAVVHLRVPRNDGGWDLGTGFMVASDLLMTNNHVINSANQAGTAEYTFNYQLDRHGKPCDPLLAYGLPGGLFYTNPELDYTVVQLKDVPAYGKPLVLTQTQVRRDDRVAIIQHPGGYMKKISMQNNFVAYADAQVVQYTTSTLPGSSGSPVFNGVFEVVAIHHSGGMLDEPGTGRRYLRNAGTSMVAILSDLRANSSKVHARLKE